MSREIQPYGLRMPPDLRATLEREANISGRSLNAEIVARLWKTVEPSRPGIDVDPVMREPSSGYLAMKITDLEREMLATFRRWPPDKQLSFLVLFK